MVQAQLHAMQGGTATPVVRVPWNDMVMIKRYLDIGAQSLLLPYVQTVEEAKNAVAYTRYPQDGVRGVAGSTRAAGYGRIKDYLKRANGDLRLLVQVETRKAMANIEAIAETEGVDGVFIGPNDLSADLGHLGNWQHPEVWKVMEEGRQENPQGRQGAGDSGGRSRRPALPRHGVSVRRGRRRHRHAGARRRRAGRQVQIIVGSA